MVEIPDAIDVDRPFSEAQVVSLEAMLGESLPPDYRAFVLEHGTPYPVDDEAVVEVEWRRWRRIDRELIGEEEGADFETLYPFFGLWRPKNIQETYERIHMHDGRKQIFIEKHFLPIGHDTGGTLYLLDLSTSGEGSVWAWGMNLNDPWSQRANVYIGFVANSFTDLITNRLKPVPEDW